MFIFILVSQNILFILLTCSSSSALVDIHMLSNYLTEVTKPILLKLNGKQSREVNKNSVIRLLRLMDYSSSILLTNFFLLTSFAATDGGLETHTAHTKEITSTENAENKRKVVSNFINSVDFEVILCLSHPFLFLLYVYFIFLPIYSME